MPVTHRHFTIGRMDITPRQVELVEQSAAAVDDILDDFAAAFYARLFTEHPSVRHMFHDDPGVQAAKLATELRRIVSALRDPDRFARQVRTLGERHGRYGVQAGHYDVVGATLLATFADSLGDAFTPELREAWGAAYGLVASLMMRASETAVSGAA